MATGQLILALTSSLPLAIGARAVVGLGDAFTFISVLRLVPHWFPPRQVPLLTQLTGICGQLGQVLSALPFLALLTGTTWATAYVSVAALGVLAIVLVLALVKDAPRGRVVATETHVRASHPRQRQDRVAASRHPARFLHPHGHAVLRHRLRADVGGALSDRGAGPVHRRGGRVADRSRSSPRSRRASSIGIFTGRYPHRRSRIVLAIIASNALVWTVVLALPGRAPLWLLVVLVVVISVGGPGSMVGFDFARTFNPSATLGTAQGMVNMGGFIASLLVMQAMGVILGAAGGYSFESFRLAWTVQYAMWTLAVVGILITRKKARRL